MDLRPAQIKVNIALNKGSNFQCSKQQFSQGFDNVEKETY